ncbi:MAG: peroxide stress protein YaaA [Eubacteriales bacterium]|nr:peroxide stress protein YaaA [Eubacteriales bacterium]
MRIIISPAKKMNEERDDFPALGLPVFLDRTETLRDWLKGLSYADAKALWSCNDKLAELNHDRYAVMGALDELPRLTPAILSYEGIQYQYMAPDVFSREALDFIQDHLRILSGFYGVLKPFDGVTPYRLEMQAKVGKFGFPEATLYGFWGDALYREVQTGNEDRFVLNLASKEYSQCVEKYLTEDDFCLTVVFGELKTDPKTGREKVITKGTLAKMARGDMVRFLAERGITEPEGIKQYDGLHFRFCPERSSNTEYVFLKVE